MLQSVIWCDLRDKVKFIDYSETHNEHTTETLITSLLSHTTHSIFWTSKIYTETNSVCAEDCRCCVR